MRSFQVLALFLSAAAISCGARKPEPVVALSASFGDDGYGPGASGKKGLPIKSREIPYDFDAPPLATKGSARLDDIWWQGAQPCPEGSNLHGGLPPEHQLVGCKTEHGKNVGRATQFYPSGAKYDEGQFENHFAEGVWTSWDEKGQRMLETTYLRGKKEGVETQWYPGGEVKSQRFYKEGVRHGVTTIWDDRGRKRTSLNYDQGKKDGLEARWAIDGQLAKVTQWRAGKEQ